jgi:autotransporter family porin
LGAGTSSEGKNRLGYSSMTTGFQLGGDVLHASNAKGTQTRVGLTAQYANSSTDTTDRARFLFGLTDKTGSIKTDTYGLGGYYTAMAGNGSYVDVVGQVNRLSNKYSDLYGGKSKQKGWQYGLSAEVGFQVGSVAGWSVEPQAQLSYLHTRYDDYADVISHFGSYATNNLRGRVGVRMNKDVLVGGQSAQYYGIVNVNHDFLDAKEVNGVAEDYDKTSAEVGLGIQGNVSKRSYVYTDARYERSFSGNKEGAKFNLGLKSSF